MTDKSRVKEVFGEQMPLCNRRHVETERFGERRDEAAERFRRT